MKQDANLIAFSATPVKGGALLFLRCEAFEPVRLRLSDSVLGQLCDTLAGVRRERTREIALRHSTRRADTYITKTLSPEKLAKYRRVAAAVAAGSTWSQAAFSEGVSPTAACTWWNRTRDQQAAAPILKPSGAIL